MSIASWLQANPQHPWLLWFSLHGLAKYLIVKELNDGGMVVQGIRSTGVNVRMEIYFTEPE